jgi:2-methylfumaryl-CoA isomerase
VLDDMGLLRGLRVVKGSAFVAAPLGGLTLAQLGADVIRFDTIGGGLDHQRWPVTRDGVSLYWAGLNKGKRSVAIDLSRAEGREPATALITARGDGAGRVVAPRQPYAAGVGHREGLHAAMACWRPNDIAA